MTMIFDNLQQVHARIRAACEAAGRDVAGVRLLAVSKTVSPEAVRDAMAAGEFAFGENYIQEGVEKIMALATAPDAPPGSAAGVASRPEWHCIGPIQSNKTRLVAAHFDWVQSVDRLKIAERLSDQRPDGLPPLQVCLQVNIDGGANKSGVAPTDVLQLANAVAKLPRIALRGLMMIPEPAADFHSALAIHQQAKALFDAVNASGALAVPMDTLSLGMTGDLEAAIHAGSTMVRIGTAIFGSRG
ncbi:MAG: YggS family pyridoxal phosphate-dependent enzyme [Comamonadaceae bacterium]|nr:MAG: YggS family pyridoxal phosphate-dependent enzyme [Comamonadaceae bacterium]